MKKILYVVSTLQRTGPINVLYNLISHLDRSKFEPIILTLSSENPGVYSLESDFKKLNVKICSLRLSRINGFMFGGKEIRKLAEREKVSVIHINGFRGDFLIKAADYKTIKIVTTINANIFDDYTMLYGKLYGRIMAYLHMQSTKGKAAIGCSNFVADRLNDRYGSNLAVIYNGVPQESYVPATVEQKLTLRKELKLSLTSHIFLFVGFLIYRKDPVTVIKAFIESQSNKDSILLMIGDGPLMDECKIISGDRKNIIFLGNQSETLKFLRASDFYIASSFSEGLPTSVMEAMGCGIPVLLSEIDPHNELVANIDSWPYTFPISDSNMLAKKMNSIVQDNYDKLRAQCRTVIENQINARIMANKYQNLYLSDNNLI